MWEGVESGVCEDWVCWVVGGVCVCVCVCRGMCVLALYLKMI